MLEVFTHPANAWLVTALIQVGVLVAAVVTGYIAGWKDQKRKQEGDVMSPRYRPEMDAPSGPQPRKSRRRKQSKV